MRTFVQSSLLLALLAAPAASANLLVNPDFDVDLDGWTIAPMEGTSIRWDAGDVDDASDSGSLRFETELARLVGGASQCRPTSAGPWHASSSVRVSGGQSGAVDISVLFFASGDCSGLPFNSQLFPPARVPPDEWTELRKFGDAPEGTGSVRFSFGARHDGPPGGSFVTRFDRTSYVPEPGSFALVAAGLGLIAGARRGGATRAPRRHLL